MREIAAKLGANWGFKKAAVTNYTHSVSADANTHHLLGAGGAKQRSVNLSTRH